MDPITPTSPDTTPADLQLQCPLFNIIPGEIRNEIFALALVQYEDDAAAYPKDSYWYRPGFSGPRKSSSSLLRTCKRAYQEGQKVFLQELEWAFWFGMYMCSHKGAPCRIYPQVRADVRPRQQIVDRRGDRGAAYARAISVASHTSNHATFRKSASSRKCTGSKVD